MSNDIAAGVIHRLREVLAELEKDKVRLDWLETIYGRNWSYNYLNSGKVITRLAIDKAVCEQEQSELEEARDYRARMEGMSRG